MKESSQINKIIPIIAVFTILGLWHLTAMILGNDLRLPSPVSTLISGAQIIMSPRFYSILFSTFMRGILSLGLSAIMALLLGFLAGMYGRIKLFLAPMVSIIRSAPTMAIIFILFSTVGSGPMASVTICFLVIFPLFYANVVEGVENVDENLLTMARLYKVEKIDVIKGIYVPSIRSYFMAGLMASVGLNFKVMISAEVIGEVSNSIGKELYLANAMLDKPQVFAWSILLIIIVGAIHRVSEKIAEKYGLKR